MVDFIITDFSNVRGGGNIVDTVPSAEDFIVDNCTISSSSSGVFVLTPGESLVGTVSLTANHTSIAVGESVVFSAFVEDTDGEPLEGLTVSFYRDGVSLGSGVSDDSGLVQLTVSSWSVGSFTCTASCQGVSSSGVTVTVSDVTPVVTSVSLTADKSILSYADSESAVLSATVLDDNDDPMEGETVTFYKGSTSIGTATTNSSGIATKTYSASGSGDVTFKASVGMIESETYSLEDCIDYDELTSNHNKFSGTGINPVYSSTGLCVNGNANADSYYAYHGTLPSTFSIEFEFKSIKFLTTATGKYSSEICVHGIELGAHKDNGIFYGNGGTLSYTNTSFNAGDIIKCDYDGSYVSVYRNDALIVKLSKTSSLTVGFKTHNTRNMCVKNMKIKPLLA